MKILLVHNHYRSSIPSGENRVVNQERQALAEAGHDVRCFERFSDDIAHLPLWSKALIPVNAVWSSRSAHDLTETLVAFQPDIVHLHNLFPLISPSVLYSCQRQHVPCVVTLHNYGQLCAAGTLYRTGAPCHDCVGRRLPTPGIRHRCYRGSAITTLPIALRMITHRSAWKTIPSAYIFLSQSHLEEHHSLDLSHSRCFVKPNFVHPNAASSSMEPLVVYIGRLTEAKGLRVLMRAWDRFSKEDSSEGLRLAIAGSGPLQEEIRSWARARASVEMLGLLDHLQCAALMQRARALIAPSEWPEPFGLVVAEAMSAGVPPVGTARGSFVDMISDHVDGLLFPPGDVHALASLLEWITRYPDQLAELGAAARRTYERRFALSGNVAMLERIYHFAIDHPAWLEMHDGNTRPPVTIPSPT